MLLVECNDDGTVGGSHRCLYDLARGLDPSRFVPVALFYQRNAYVERLTTAGVETSTWDGRRERERTKTSRAALAESILVRARYLKRERIGLVHLNNSPSVGFSEWLPAARLVGVPCISHARAAYDRPRSRVGHWLARRFDRVIAISRYIESDLVAAGWDRGRIRQIYDGIDLDLWRRQDDREVSRTRAALGIPASVMLVLMVGHFRFWKGQDVALAALRRIDAGTRRGMHLAFVGGSPASDADYQAKFARDLREHGPTEGLSFLGERDDVVNLMNAADVVLHASSIPEPFGLVVLEGMALGKAVVASELGGPSEIVTPASGALFDPSRPEQLATILVDLLRTPGRRRSMALAAVDRVREFDVRRNIRRIGEVYEELLG